MGSLVPSSGDKPRVGGSAINNETGPLQSDPDEHGISFVLSDLLISSVVVKKLESRQLLERERNRPNRTCEGEK